MNSNNYPPTTTTSSSNYLFTQARLLTYTTLFWLFIYLARQRQYELSRAARFLLVDLVQLVIAKTGLTQTIRTSKENIRHLLHQLNVFVSVQQTVRSFNLRLFKLSEWLNVSATTNVNLATLIWAKIGQLVQLVQSVQRSFVAIANTFTFNVKRVLRWPMKMKQALGEGTAQIRSFWRQIEQIIQIAKLPLEILTLLFSFIKGIGAFLRRIEKPRISRYR